MKVKKLKSLNSDLIKKVLADLYPETSSRFDISVSTKLFSPYHIELPESFLKRITSFNKKLNTLMLSKFALLKQGELQLRSDLYSKDSFKNFSNQAQVLSCLDFHIDLSKNEIKLIEANTNASGYLIGSLVYTLHNLEFKTKFDQLIEMFKAGKVWNENKLFITDEHPEKQKMFLEFLLYQEFFKQNGKTLEIIHIEDLDKSLKSLLEKNKSIGIYNRSTDFYLENTNTLRESFLNQSVSLSPNPIGYDLMAHKDNLDEWQGDRATLSSEDTEEIQSFLLQSKPMQSLFETADLGWSSRKKYFFKPSDSYGGKATYKGSSISRKYFDSAWNDNFLAQAYFPAPKFTDEDGLDWKFDLRVYVLEDKVLYSLARVYQGQITNFSQLGGGFAPVTYY